MSDFRNEAQRKATYKLKSVPLAGMIWVITCLLIVFYIFSLIPPKTIDQLGFRGVAMENIQNTNIVKARNMVNVPPDEWPPFEAEGTLASEAYENVPTLGHLTQANFDRIMTLVTEWVSPEEGCNYCHVVLDDGGVDYVSDAIYTKVVSRRMFQMTQHINSTWGDHVQPSGVNCYTCHRGNPVPAEIWFTDPQPVEAAREGAGNNKGQNFFMRDNAYSSLPYETFTEYLTELDMGVGTIRNIPTTALPVSNVLEPDLNATERTYGLMMHISEALGTNCTFCHNSRSFIEWSVPQRVVGWYGIRSVQDINENFLIPLQPEYPAARLGPLGDAPKAHCATCHQAVNKPLNGADMISAYPELAAPGADIDLRTAAYKFTDPATEEAAPAEEPAAEEAATEEAAPAEEPAAEEAATEEAAPAEEPAAEEAATEEAAPAEEPAAEEAATEEAAPAEEPAAEEAATEEAAPAEEPAAEEAATEEAAPAEEPAAEEAATEEAAPAEEPAAEEAATEEAAPAEEPAAEEAATEEAAPAEEPAAEEAATEEAAPAEEPAAEEAATEEAAPAEEPAAEEAATEEAAPAEEPAAEEVATEEAAPAEEPAAEEAATEEAAPAEEPAAEEAATEEAAPAEEPAAEEAATEEAAPAEEPAAEEAATEEAAPAEEPAAEEAATEEAAPAEEPAAEEAATEEAAPAEEPAAEAPAEEPAAVDVSET